MTSLRPAPPEAVAAALSEVAELGPFFSIGAGEHGGMWRSVEEAYADGFAQLVSAFATRHGLWERRVAVSVVQLGHAARLWSPVLGCAVTHGIVPDLGGLRQRVDGSALWLPEARGWWAPRGQALVRVMYRLVMEEHLAVLARGLRVKVAAGLLHGNAASALAGAAHAVVRARPGLRRPVTSLAVALLGVGDLRGTGAFTGPDLAFRRRSCCLYYRLPDGGVCGDCCLIGKHP
ncbi:(2Fe-2S)-binding protein [Streptosporangium sp. NPDC050855]|uniref:(2Fe-2S)-binding protein n=1 Tax=Streptosporangium sp. NPDC050855 TaxID=3366194 RepID=UPI0037ABCA70